RVRPRDDNFHAMVEQALQQSPLPIMAQRYLPAIARGDKRVLLVDGEPAGAVNRLPPPGDVRANLHIGGRAEKARVDATDRKMAAALRPFLQSLGIWFAGLDVIGGLLTEINVTSPTGVRELKRLSGEDVAARLIGWIEQKLAQ
ncbi:MAG: glutathione synthase, partial [Hyphomicrobiales bacterium]|nr:glutathione synthase [Hyphomicrobiales bacterium]